MGWDDAALLALRSLTRRGTPRLTAEPGSRDATGPCRQSVREYFGAVIGADLTRRRDLPITLLAGHLPAPGSMTQVAVTPGYVQRMHLDPNRPAGVLGSEIEFGTPQV